MEGRTHARLILPERVSRIARSLDRQRGGRAATETASPAVRGFGSAPTVPTLHRTLEAELGLDAAALELFEALRAHRLSVARNEAVPPFVVASDRTLRDMARTRPRSETELLSVYGMGPVKAARYGAGFLSVLQDRAP